MHEIRKGHFQFSQRFVTGQSQLILLSDFECLTKCKAAKILINNKLKIIEWPLLSSTVPQKFANSSLIINY